jgi:hypothetical protein
MIKIKNINNADHLIKPEDITCIGFAVLRLVDDERRDMIFSKKVYSELLSLMSIPLIRKKKDLYI